MSRPIEPKLTEPLPEDSSAVPPGRNEVQSSSLSLGDVYFVLFRNKWKILLCTLLGLAGAAVMFAKRPPRYQSEAKILIRYVLERRPVSPVGPSAQITAPDSQGQDILNSEVEILTSSDLADLVADAIGPERILASLGGGHGRNRASSVIQQNLKVEVPRNSKIIRLVFRHPDAGIVQPVLSLIMSNYFNRHVQMHGGTGFVDEALSRQAERLRTQLEEAEAGLRKIKSNAGIISLEETKRASSLRLSQLRISLDETEASLAERKAVLQRIQTPLSATNSSAESIPIVPPERMSEYRNVLTHLESSRREEVNLLGQFAEESRFVQGARERILKLEQRKADLEKDYPQLIASVPSTVAPDARPNPATEIMQIAALQAKLDVFKSQFDTLSREATNYEQIEVAVSRLGRERDLLQTNYYSLNASIQQARFDEALSPGRVSNFSVVQTPSPPSKDYSNTLKPVGVLLVGGLVGGVLLAFLIEFVLDRRIKRPIDVVKELRLPLFVSIPLLRLGGTLKFHASALTGPGGRGGSIRNNTSMDQLDDYGPENSTVGIASGVPLRSENREDDFGAQPTQKSHTALGVLFKRKSSESMAPVRSAPTPDASPEFPIAERNRLPVAGIVWHANSGLEAYCEVLRSRIVAHFEAVNLTRKPKLVGVASCNRGSGVSSIAGSLAASLSQIGDGKVLLVDLNLERGAAHPFYDGKPVIGVSEALDRDRKARETENSNLVLATANDSGDSPLAKLPGTLPRRFAGLVPRLKASEYDYIIFDLPPIDQTSITPRVSSYMDLTLLVLESERTGLDVAKQVTALLADLNVNVACVLNKTRKYVPAWLQEEL